MNRLMKIRTRSSEEDWVKWNIIENSRRSKRMKGYLFFLVAVLLCVSVTLFAYDGDDTDALADYDIISNDVFYKVLSNNPNTAEVVRPAYNEGSYYILSSVYWQGTSYTVTRIGDYAFENIRQLTYINIPNSVTEIGNYAFYNCNNLTMVILPDSVTSIGAYAFEGCSSLTSITIPNSVTSIGTGAFSNCYGLTSVTMSNSVTVIGTGAFFGCWELSSITIPDSVISIGAGAFVECVSLTSITIPDSVTSIGAGAFTFCDGLTSIYLSNSIASIDSETFYYCASLASITIPDSVTSIGANAFEGCSSLTSITIPNSVTSIGANAFEGCSSLTSITIPNSVTTIGNYAFYGCSSLLVVAIPEKNKITNIGLDDKKIVWYAPSFKMTDVRFGVNAIIDEDDVVTLTYAGDWTDPISFTSYSVSINSGTFTWPGGKEVKVFIVLRDAVIFINTVGNGSVSYSLDGIVYKEYDSLSDGILMEKGKDIHIKATPSPGNRFSEWSGFVPFSDKTKDTITVSVNSDISLTAEFTQDTSGFDISKFKFMVMTNIAVIILWAFEMLRG